MKRFFVKTVILVAVAAVVISCDNKLDIEQHGVENADYYYSTDEEILTASADLYINMRSLESNDVLLKCALDGDFWGGGGQHGDMSMIDNLAEYAFDAEDAIITGYFTALYTLVFSANTIIDRVDPEMSDIARRTVAEAKVFRSYAYFELITLWGTPPLVDHCLQPDEYKQPNCDAATLWSFVNQGYEDAIASNALPEKSDPHDKTVWRITRQYAQALYGKALLWQKRYSEAAELLDEVIGSGKYELFDGEYGDRNTMANKFNCENIFESIFPNDPANPVSSHTGYMLGWRTDRHLTAGLTAYNIEMGFGFITPTRDLYDAFVAHDGDSYRRKQTIKNYDEMEAMGLGLQEGAIEMGEGVYMWKDRYTTDKTPAMWCTAKDYVWMRLAEVYLLAAEAHLESGNASKAVEYVNVIREKAQIPSLASVTLQDIKDEKRFELCREGKLLQDLLRWGDAYDKLKGVGKTEPIFHSDRSITYFDCGNTDDKCGFKQGKNELLPFPAKECRLNDKIVQNPGY